MTEDIPKAATPVASAPDRMAPAQIAADTSAHDTNSTTTANEKSTKGKPQSIGTPSMSPKPQQQQHQQQNQRSGKNTPKSQNSNGRSSNNKNKKNRQEQAHTHTNPQQASTSGAAQNGVQSGEGISNTNMYISGLSPAFTDQDLILMCSKYGDIVSAKAILDQQTGKCRGYGFVMFSLHDCAREAVDELTKQGMQCSFAKETSARTSSRNVSDAHYDDTNLYMANIPRTWMEEDLLQMLMPWGTVISTRVLRDSGGLSRGVGFCRMETRDQCENIINNFNHMIMPGCIQPLQIRYADSTTGKKGGGVRYGSWDGQMMGTQSVGVAGGRGNRKGSLGKNRGSINGVGWNMPMRMVDANGMLIMPQMMDQNGVSVPVPGTGASAYYAPHVQHRGSLPNVMNGPGGPMPLYGGAGVNTGGAGGVNMGQPQRYMQTPMSGVMGMTQQQQQQPGQNQQAQAQQHLHTTQASGVHTPPNTPGEGCTTSPTHTGQLVDPSDSLGGMGANAAGQSAYSAGDDGDAIHQMQQQFQQMNFGMMMPQHAMGMYNAYGQPMCMVPQGQHHQMPDGCRLQQPGQWMGGPHPGQPDQLNMGLTMGVADETSGLDPADGTTHSNPDAVDERGSSPLPNAQ
ncbi:hypothetical protein, variant [Sphaeroforma arctica JP610]|nr:hypothetical protein, variant [Sphaeroforma arctica JP610]KNC84985.1 hypothetical protein, variant [Sphaeroforma arctica JP610]|eukprot:XP_014158887.1 hypothetical protein, variant [Sphaeroforma arctica JP610]